MEQITLRPSAAARWIACPASVQLSAKMPKGEAGAAAQRGTAIHSLSESCFMTSSAPEEWLGIDVEGIRMDQDAITYARKHLDYIETEELRLGNVFVEQFVTAYESPAVRVAGTADVLGWSDDTGEFIIGDLKTGRGWVDADSDQMRIYALGGMRMAKKQFKSVTMTIVQPVHGVNRSHTMTVPELLKWEAQVLIPAVQAAMATTAEAVPSEAACQWCPAKAICPAHIEPFNVMSVAQAPPALSDDQLTSFLDSIAKVEGFIKALETYATKRIKDGAALRGWQMGPKKAHRSWVNEADAAEWLHKAGLVSSQIFPHKIITPAAAEELLEKGTTVTDTLTKKVSSGLTLCRSFGIGE